MTTPSTSTSNPSPSNPAPPPPSTSSSSSPSNGRHNRPLTVDPPSGPVPPYPIKLSGKVISGFGRGSKELGIPTANIPILGLDIGGHSDIQSGIYYGWAGLQQPQSQPQPQPTATAAAAETDDVPVFEEPGVYPMVMSIGWNPFYKNTMRSVEVHIIHAFRQDFYGARLNLLILGFIRPEFDYVSKEALIQDILFDIEVTKRSLERETFRVYRDDAFLKMTE